MIECIWPLSRTRNPFRSLLDSVVHFLKIAPGFCNICGCLTVFNTSWANFREGTACLRCGSVNRQRQMAAVLLAELLSKGTAGDQRSRLKAATRKFRSISTLPTHLTVWNAETTRALHHALANRLQANYISSEYADGQLKSGELHNGTLHVDMQKTHFEDGSIDFILSSDVLEHVPQPLDALKESYRVLKPGGAHIFTAPFYQHRFTMERRSEIAADGSVVHLKKPWYHDDPVRPSEGALVFNIFAPELLCEIEKIGFEARLHLLHSPVYGVYGNNGIVVVARKAVPPDYDRDWVFG